MKTADAMLMGYVVTVKKETRRFVDAGGRVSWPAEDVVPRAGWITGVRHVYCGQVESGYTDHDGEVHPNCFVPECAVKVFLVAYWPSVKPVMVRAGHMDAGGSPVSPSRRGLDLFRSQSPDEYEKWRASLREDVKNQRRGPGGRFVKPQKAEATVI